MKLELQPSRNKPKNSVATVNMPDYQPASCKGGIKLLPAAYQDELILQNGKLMRIVLAVFQITEIPIDKHNAADVINYHVFACSGYPLQFHHKYLVDETVTLMNSLYLHYQKLKVNKCVHKVVSSSSSQF
jgi:hypothetical protein